MRDKSWTASEDDYLRSHYSGFNSVPVIAAALGRTPSGVRSRAYRLGIVDYTMESYYNDPTVKICLNCTKPRCRPDSCKLARIGKRGRGLKHGAQSMDTV